MKLGRFGTRNDESVALEAAGIEAVIFDMDGLLVESESLWRRTEAEVAAGLGIELQSADFAATMGMRIDAVVQRWFSLHPWTGPSVDDVVEDIVDRMVARIAKQPLLPGVRDTLAALTELGLPLAVCSSSSPRLIEAMLDAFGLRDAFHQVHSAMADDFGKPHPAPYLSTARALDVDPTHCLVFEDSFHGCLSAKSAGMRLIAVPAPPDRHDVRFGLADLVLASLAHFRVELLDELARGTRAPTLARPRFHLAFPVHDLGAARAFYGQVLGCPEGRSSEHWVDFDLCGHQIVAHLVPETRTDTEAETCPTHDVDGHPVPVRHFGLVLPHESWLDVRARLERAQQHFLMAPSVRFAGQPGEQHTLFVRDPSGNALEFKSFRDDESVFRKA